MQVSEPEYSYKCHWWKVDMKTFKIDRYDSKFVGFNVYVICMWEQENMQDEIYPGG